MLSCTVKTSERSGRNTQGMMSTEESEIEILCIRSFLRKYTYSQSY